MKIYIQEYDHEHFNAKSIHFLILKVCRILRIKQYYLINSLDYRIKARS